MKDFRSALIVLSCVSIGCVPNGQVLAQSGAVTVSSVLRCGPLSSRPAQDPAFATNFSLEVSMGKLMGERQTNKRPGKEIYSGSINPNGSIEIRGRGARYEGKGAWESRFSGKVNDTGVTTLKGQLHTLMGKVKGKRDCELTFIELGTELRRKLGLASTSTTNIVQESHTEIKRLKELRDDTAKQLKEVREHAEKVQLGPSKGMAQTQTDLKQLEQKQAALIRQLEEAQRQLGREQFTTTKGATEARAKLHDLEQKQMALSKQFLEIKQQVERDRSATADSAARARADVQQLEQKQGTLSKQIQEGQRRLADTDATVEAMGKFLHGIVLPAWENPKDWMMRVSAVPVQQQQFCRIVDRFYEDLDLVYRSHNEIKKNTLFRDRQRDMAALLPRGDFQNWVVQIKEVTQAPDGSAAVMVQPPCRAMLGSDACQKNGSKIRATVPPGSPLFRELSRVSEGDFVLVSGKILYAATETPEQPLPIYAVYQPGSHCSASNGSRQEDVFVTEIAYLVQLR